METLMKMIARNPYDIITRLEIVNELKKISYWHSVEKWQSENPNIWFSQMPGVCYKNFLMKKKGYLLFCKYNKHPKFNFQVEENRWLVGPAHYFFNKIDIEARHTCGPFWIISRNSCLLPEKHWQHVKQIADRIIHQENDELMLFRDCEKYLERLMSYGNEFETNFIREFKKS